MQLDNTCCDNKNKYVLTFAALLVQMDIFRKVLLYLVQITVPFVINQDRVFTSWPYAHMHEDNVISYSPASHDA